MSSPASDVPGKKKHVPYVPETMEMKEFTLRAILLGLFMTVVLGAANAYLGLRAGIPIPVGAFDAHWDAIGAGVRLGDVVNVVGTSTCIMAISDHAAEREANDGGDRRRLMHTIKRACLFVVRRTKIERIANFRCGPRLPKDIRDVL